jgi:hypothetical protein
MSAGSQEVRAVHAGQTGCPAWTSGSLRGHCVDLARQYVDNPRMLRRPHARNGNIGWETWCVLTVHVYIFYNNSSLIFSVLKVLLASPNSIWDGRLWWRVTMWDIIIALVLVAVIVMWQIFRNVHRRQGRYWWLWPWCYRYSVTSIDDTVGTGGCDGDVADIP